MGIDHTSCINSCFSSALRTCFASLLWRFNKMCYVIWYGANLKLCKNIRLWKKVSFCEQGLGLCHPQGYITKYPPHEKTIIEEISLSFNFHGKLFEWMVNAWVQTALWSDYLLALISICTVLIWALRGGNYNPSEKAHELKMAMAEKNVGTFVWQRLCKKCSYHAVYFYYHRQPS